MKALLWVLTLPGRLVCQLAYLFPRRGQVLVSGRQKDSPIAHLWWSLCIYAAVIFVVWLNSGPPDRRVREPSPSAPVSVAGADQPSEQIATADTQASAQVSAISGPSASTPESPPSPPPPSTPDASQQPQINSQAAQGFLVAALEAGQPQHWDHAEDGTSGVVAVSDIQADGPRVCRTYRLTITAPAEMRHTAEHVACKDPGGPWVNDLEKDAQLASERHVSLD